MAQVRPQYREILDLILGDGEALTGDVDARLERSIVYVLQAAQAGAIHEAYGHIQRLSNSVFPDTAIGEEIDRLASQFGISRGAATFAQGWVGAVGLPEPEIPVGSILRRSDGREYQTQATGILPDGTTHAMTGDQSENDALIGLPGTGWVVPVIAVESGSEANAANDVDLSFVSPIAGVDPVVKVRNGVTGAVDFETDESLRGRLLARWRNPPQGGTKADYEAWVLGASTPDDPITRAFVVPPPAGSNVVTVYVVNDGGGIPSANPPTPSAQAITNAEAAIDASRPLSADRNVIAPTMVAITPTITLSPDTAAIRTSIENEIDVYLIDNAQPGQELPVSILQAVVSNAAGGGDAQITDPVANWTPAAGELLYRGAITWA